MIERRDALQILVEKLFKEIGREKTMLQIK